MLTTWTGTKGINGFAHWEMVPMGGKVVGMDVFFSCDFARVLRHCCLPVQLPLKYIVYRWTGIQRHRQTISQPLILFVITLSFKRADFTIR